MFASTPKRIATFNALHLGDNLVHLHFMRALAKAYPDITFTHGANDEHLGQLAPLAWDLDNLTVQSIAHTPQGAINAWRGVEGHWYGHPQRNEFAAYHLDWFRVLAERMGLHSPFHTASDLLFDYPALKRPASPGPSGYRLDWDFLIINSLPGSGQFTGYSSAEFTTLIARLSENHEVVTTAPSGVEGVPFTTMFSMDVTRIGHLSQHCRCIIAVATGPIWPTFNVWNQQSVALRVILLDHERLELAPNTVHANRVSLVPEILQQRGLLP